MRPSIYLERGPRAARSDRSLQFHQQTVGHVLGAVIPLRLEHVTKPPENRFPPRTSRPGGRRVPYGARRCYGGASSATERSTAATSKRPSTRRFACFAGWGCRPSFVTIQPISGASRTSGKPYWRAFRAHLAIIHHSGLGPATVGETVSVTGHHLRKRAPSRRTQT